MDIRLRLPGQHGRKPTQGPKARPQPTKKLQDQIEVQGQRCEGPCRLRGLAHRQTVMRECERSNVGLSLISGSLLVPCQCDQPATNHATNQRAQRHVSRDTSCLGGLTWFHPMREWQRTTKSTRRKQRSWRPCTAYEPPERSTQLHSFPPMFRNPGCNWPFAGTAECADGRISKCVLKVINWLFQGRTREHLCLPSL